MVKILHLFFISNLWQFIGYNMFICHWIWKIPLPLILRPSTWRSSTWSTTMPCPWSLLQTLLPALMGLRRQQKPVSGSVYLILILTQTLDLINTRVLRSVSNQHRTMNQVQLLLPTQDRTEVQPGEGKEKEGQASTWQGETVLQTGICLAV